MRNILKKELEKADLLVANIEKLGKAHPLFPYALKIREAAEALRKEYNAHKKTTKKAKILTSELDVCVSNFINKYLESIHEAKKSFDRDSVQY